MAGPSVTDKDLEYVLDATKDGWYGEKAYHYVEKFEKEFAMYHSRKYALMTPNCTSALHLILAGLNIKDNDEVIVPDCTWIGSVAGITYQRAKTVFADIDENNWCICPKSLENNINEKTKAVITVDLYGNMPNYDKIIEICNKYKIHLIEDAAEALGAKFKEKKAGSFGIGSTFSFHRTKTITTGEGGMLLLDDLDLFKRCKFLRDHGRQPGTYFNTEVTFKYMPFNLQAALGYAQFLRIDELVSKKRWILHKFKEKLSHVPDIKLNEENKDVYNGAWATSLVFGKTHKISKDFALQEIPKHGFPVRPFFYPLSSLPAFNKKHMKKNNPVAYDVSSRAINLPCALNLTEKNINDYSNAILKLLGL